MKLRTILNGAAAPVALSIALTASPAMAQEVPVPVTPVTAEDLEEAPPADNGTIFVTGSRIRRNEFTSSSPLTVIDPEISARQGLNSTASMVQGSPIAAGSDQITAALSSNFLTNGGTGAETISLRGLGAERTLVLLNGRRAGPSGTRGGVSSFDLNVLPQSIVASVELLKDGASSVYGSDAVAGVVNLITKTDTDGIEFDFFGSVPTHEGGEQWSGSATWGTTFDRGHILISGSYSRRNELARGDRSYLGCGENYVFTDETHSTRADLIDPRTGNYACEGSDSGNTWGHVWTYDYSYTDSDGDGLADLGSPFGSNIPGSDGTGAATLFQYSYGNDNLGRYIPAAGPRQGAPAFFGVDDDGNPIFGPSGAGQIALPEGWFPVGYDGPSTAVMNRYHPLMDNDTVTPETNLYTAYLDATYELTDGIEFYAELLYNRRDNFVNASGQVYQFGLGEIYDYYYDELVPQFDGEGNPVLDDDGVQVFAPAGDGLQTTDPTFGYNFDPNAAGFIGPALFSPTAFNPYADSSVKVDYYRAVAGFRGDITSNWSYDLYGQWSRSDGEYSSQTALKDAIATANFRSATNAPNGYRTSRCPNGRTTVSDRQCVFVDWYSPRFNYGEFTQAEYDFLFAWDTGNTEYTQKYVEGFVSGELPDLWAGPIGLSFGATIRQDEINDVPGPIRQADNGFNFGGAGVTAGDAVTKEAFAEIRIPLLNDFPLVQSLNFTGAARVTNVIATRASDGATDEDNGNWTYMLGLDWEVTDFLRLTGTYGTSFRAPALFQQFLADQVGSLSQRDSDPCIQWGLNLAQGAISQQFADNCEADGVPENHSGAGVSASIISGGSLGLLDPETSTAWTVSAKLEPQFPFLPNTKISLAVDYFDIEVRDEITQLGARNLLASCYASDFFPTDPLCAKFFRMDDLAALPDSDPLKAYLQDGSTSNLGVAFDQYFNVSSQQSRGVDVTARIVHDFPGDTTLTLQGQATWQTHDTIALFEGFTENSNGEAGDPIFVADIFASLERGPWSVFYSLDVIGSTNDEEDYIEANGDLCPTLVSLGTVCVDLTTPAQFYHSASITHMINDDFRITAGMSNITDNRPPRTTQLGGDGTRSLGQGLQYSQYDLLGRRVFVNLNLQY